MPRELNQTQPFQDRLVKLIPTEIVAAYMLLTGLLGFAPVTADAPKADGAPGMDGTLVVVVFVALLALTPFYLWRVNKVSNAPQIGVTTASFAVWVYSLGGPFVVWKIYDPRIAAVALVLWCLMAATLTPAKPDAAPGAKADAAPAPDKAAGDAP